MQKGFRNIEIENYEIDIFKFVHCLTFSALTISLFGYNFNVLDDPNSVWIKTYENVSIAIRSPSTFMFPSMDWFLKYFIPGRKLMDKSVDEFNALLLGLIQEKRNQIKVSDSTDRLDSEKDLLTLMLEAEAEADGEGMESEKEELRVKWN
jgi:cytochrome P450